MKSTVTPRSSLWAWFLAAQLLVPLVAGAGEVKVHPPLVPLPAEKLAALAPLLRTGDFVLLESDQKGWEKQVTTITLAKASPQAVREVLIHPERYEDFVRNMVGRGVKKNPDGTFDHGWKLDFSVASFSGVNRYRLLPPREGESVGAVELFDPTGLSTYRWEFHPSAHGGGTILVVYGFTDVRHSGGLIDKILARAETLEHGLALITQMTFHRAMASEAEKHPGEITPYVAPAAGSSATGYGFLLDRGLIAILRHQGNRLVDFSLIDRTRAAAQSLVDELGHPERWRYIPSLARVTPREGRDGMSVVELEQSLPLMSWTTSFGVAPSGGGVDLFGVDGDLRGGRLRFDLRPDKPTGLTQLILRGQLAYDRSSVVMRNLFKMEPLFEDGVNVGLSYIVMRAVKSEVEKRAGGK